MWQNFRNFSRALKLAYIFSRYGAGDSLKRVGVPPSICALFSLFARPRLPEREGERLCLALTAMGPTFIKLGQALSTRADLVGEAVAEDLSGLQDDLPPFPSHLARKIVEAELGIPVEEAFAHFEDEPVAAASIAQVHLATTSEGMDVAVKILRPGIRHEFSQDLALFDWIAAQLEMLLPAMRRLKPREVVQTFERSIRRELDLRMEAACADRIRENVKQDPEVYIPAVDWNRTAESVLTLERIDGIPISDVEALKAAGHDVNQLIIAAANTFFQQVFRDGFFHADLHPGNIFVNRRGQLVLVDFGITGSLDRRSQWFVAEILRGFLNEDFRHVAEVHIMAGYVPRNHSVEDFALACHAIAKPILGKPLQDISAGKLLGQLFQVSALFDMETQPQLLLLQKNMVLAEGMGRMLNPNINMWKLAEPLIEDWARSHLTPQGRARMLAEELSRSAKRIPELAHRLDSIITTTDLHGLKLHPDSIRALRHSHNRCNWTLIAFAIIAVIILLSSA